MKNNLFVTAYSIAVFAGLLLAELPGHAFEKLSEKIPYLLKNNKIEEALAILNRQIEINPHNVDAYLYRSHIFDLKNQTDYALNDCDKAILLNPNLDRAYVMRACLFVKQRKYNQTIEECNRAIALNPLLGEAYSFRGTAFHFLNDDKIALEDFEKAISLGPAKVKSQALLERGYILFNQRKFEQSISDYTQAIELNIQPLSARKMRADIYRATGDYPNQIKDLHVAGELAPRDISIIEKRAYAHFNLGNMKDAIADFSNALRLNPKSTFALSCIAAAYNEIGLIKKSIEFRTKNIKLNPSDSFEYIQRANAYQLLGKYELAKQDRIKVLKLTTPQELWKHELCSPLIDYRDPASEPVEKIIEEQLKEKPIVLPFRYDGEDNQHGHLCVPVEINGKFLMMMLDSGCCHSDIWNHSTSKLGIVNKNELESKMANGRNYKYGYFKAKKFQLGNLILPNVLLEIVDGIPGFIVLDGFLGGNILEKFCVTINYENKQVTFASSFRVSPGHDYVILPMRVHEHRPCCEITIDGKITRQALLDTGCPQSTAADSLLRPVLNHKLKFEDKLLGPWLGSLSAENVPLKTISLNKRLFKAPIFSVFPSSQAPEAASEIVLGDDFLRTFKTVTFDYFGRRVIFEPH